MVLQAYIDESEGADGSFVLGGHIASAEDWAAFSVEWERMLSRAVLHPKGHYAFKMSEMARSDERMGRVPGFYRIIEKHVPLSIQVRMNVRDFERAKRRVHVPGITIDSSRLTAYMFACRGLMDRFHAGRPQMTSVLSLTDRVDFYFDDRHEKRVILDGWNSYLEQRMPEVRPLYGAAPRFENDEDFLPLQAADLWVWWARKWHEEGTPEKLARPDFGEWRAKELRPNLDLVFSEDQLAEQLRLFVQGMLGPDRMVIDTGVT